MIKFTPIKNNEELSNCIFNSYKKFIYKEEEHPFVFDGRYEKQDQAIGYYVVEDDKIIGIIFISPFHSKEAYYITYNLNIHITKEYRGKALGQKCYDILINDLIINSAIENLIVTVYQEQSNTIKWLINNGFVQIGYLDEIEVNCQINKRVVFLVKKLLRIEG